MCHILTFMKHNVQLNIKANKNFFLKIQEYIILKNLEFKKYLQMLISPQICYLIYNRDVTSKMEKYKTFLCNMIFSHIIFF